MADFHIDTSEFNKALAFVQSVVPRDMAEVINKGGLTAIVGSRENKYAGQVIGAIQRTPRADKAKIKGLDRRIIAGAVLKRARAKGEKLTRDEINRRIKAEYGRRLRATAYTAGPGWSNAAKAFGGRGVKTQAGFGKSLAAHGSGEPASASHLVAVLTNTAPAAEKIGSQALQAALNQTAGAMVEFGQKILQKRFDKIAGRK